MLWAILAVLGGAGVWVVWRGRSRGAPLGTDERVDAEVAAPVAGPPSPGELRPLLRATLDDPPEHAAVTLHAAAASLTLHGVPATYVAFYTEGLVAAGRDELVVWMLLDETPGWLESGIESLATVARLLRAAPTGSQLWPGDALLAPGAEASVFDPRFGGLLLTPPGEPVAGLVGLPRIRLVGVGITHLEARLYRERGPGRLIGRLAAQSRWFWPWQTDRSRPDVVTREELEAERTPIQAVSWVRAWGWATCARAEDLASAEGRVVQLHLLPSDRRALTALLGQLPEDAPFLLQLRPAPSASALLTWDAGQTGAAGLEGAGQLSAACLLVAPADGLLSPVVEDGMVVGLASDALLGLRRALLAGEPYTTPTTRPGESLQVSWAPRTCFGPPEGWDEEHGWFAIEARGDLPGAGSARLLSWALFTDRPSPERLIEPDALASYLRALVSEARAALAASSARDAARMRGLGVEDRRFLLLRDLADGAEDGAVLGEALPAAVVDALGAVLLSVKVPPLGLGRGRLLLELEVEGVEH